MDKLKSLKRWAPVLEELNKNSGGFMEYDHLLKSTGLNAPTLTRRVNELQEVGYVERAGMLTGITEKGITAFTTYKKITELEKQIP